MRRRGVSLGPKDVLGTFRIEGPVGWTSHATVTVDVHEGVATLRIWTDEGIEVYEGIPADALILEGEITPESTPR